LGKENENIIKKYLDITCSLFYSADCTAGKLTPGRIMSGSKKEFLK